MVQCVAVCVSVLQCVSVCCGVLQCVTACLLYVAVSFNELDLHHDDAKVDQDYADTQVVIPTHNQHCGSTLAKRYRQWL